MTRTPPNVRRRLTGGAQGGPGEGILRHTQGQNKTSCGKCFPEVSGLTDHQAQMPQHESCRHIHEDYQEFIFGCISTVRILHKHAFNNFQKSHQKRKQGPWLCTYLLNISLVHSRQHGIHLRPRSPKKKCLRSQGPHRRRGFSPTSGCSQWLATPVRAWSRGNMGHLCN